MSTFKPDTWRPLPLPVSYGLPVLLVSADMGPSSYVVSISDMANMWSEKLDRKAICMRAWSENTSIDPSDTEENMNKFLSCLKSALDPTQDGHDTTSLSLSPATVSDTGEGGLTINVTCRLQGFSPLRWPIHLKKLPSSAVATELVLPLIQANFDRLREVHSLTEVIKCKDSVITKMSDKLEAMGAGLEHVFTALSGRKGVTRAAAEDRVKGVGSFNVYKWKDELDSNTSGPGGVSELIQGVFGASGLDCRTSLEIDSSPALDQWWHGFQPTGQFSQQKQTKVPPSRSSTPTVPKQSTIHHDDDDDDDDFQVQSTPPHLRWTEDTAHSPHGTGHADATVSKNQDFKVPDSGPSSVLSDRRRQPETERTTGRLGAIGVKRQPAQPRHPPSSPSHGDDARVPLDDDEETASEASDDDDVTASLQNSPPASPPAESTASNRVQKKGGLGVIGGGATKAHSSIGETEVTNTLDKPHHATLGKIGGKSPKPMDQDDGESRGRSTQQKEPQKPEEKPRESSQERADRKREELKRELERKAAAGPTKKKRRF
ncbi:hypothetical protein E4U17_006388 [Claviceps sp. LM77 group G4]|nr:hypothetical protein E4U17_006388 [Claviceps sp. LM77 group G4]KAG6086094.1 hypothetical protein E4U33_000092 [Claviceps sp. LM78 group G4]